MTNQELITKLKQAENDYDMFVAAGPNAFETEEEYQDALQDAYGVVYSLTAMLQGRDEHLFG